MRYRLILRDGQIIGMLWQSPADGPLRASSRYPWPESWRNRLNPRATMETVTEDDIDDRYWDTGKEVITFGPIKTAPDLPTEGASAHLRDLMQ